MWLVCISCAGTYMAFLDGNFVLNPIKDYAHLAGRGLARHIIPAGNSIHLPYLFSLSE